MILGPIGTLSEKPPPLRWWEYVTAVMNIMARKYNAEKGFPFPVRLTTSQQSVFDLSSDEFDAACKKAVEERNAEAVTDYVTRFDIETGRIMKVFQDGRVEYVLD